MTSLYTGIVSKFLFPLHERLKGHSTVAVHKNLERSQWMDQASINEQQLIRCKNYLGHISQTVPYYKKLFSEIGFLPDRLSCLEDLQKLPFLTKPVIRENIEELKASDAQGLARFNTGGSSGEPLIFYIGKERVSHDVAAKWRATRWWDVDIGDAEIVIWGSPIELSAQDRVKQIRDQILRTRLLQAFEMSDEKLDSFLSVIRSRKPRMLFGYPSALSHIARYAEKQGKRMDKLGIRVAFVTSERLYDNQREDIQRVFGCKVANGYGGRDAGFIAHECPEGSMHITAEDIIVEIVDGDGNVLPHGEAGEIVTTHLATKDFPFVRYKTGDIGVLSEETCACGRGLPILGEIQGRTTDFIVASDGTVIHGLALIYILRDVAEIQSFQIVQESIELIRIAIVADASFNEVVAAKITQGFHDRLGPSVTVVIEKVEAIMPERSGKFRYVVSRVTV